MKIRASVRKICEKCRLICLCQNWAQHSSKFFEEIINEERKLKCGLSNKNSK